MLVHMPNDLRAHREVVTIAAKQAGFIVTRSRLRSHSGAVPVVIMFNDDVGVEFTVIPLTIGLVRGAWDHWRFAGHQRSMARAERPPV